MALFRISRKIIISAVCLLFLLVLAGCYMVTPADSGEGVTLNLALPRSMATGAGDPDNEIWVVGFLVEESSEQLLREAVWVEDRYNAYYSPGPNTITAGDVQKAWEDLAVNGCVTFDGGQPYFQFPMNRVVVSNSYAYGSFVIEGVPAGKTYYLYLRVYEDRIEGLQDLDKTPEAVSALHYYNDNWFNDYGSAPNGWHYVRNWTLNNYGAGFEVPQALIILDQYTYSFQVESDKVSTISLFLVDY